MKSNKKKKRNNDKRVNFILVGVIVLLLILLVALVATKTNKGQMKDKSNTPSRSLTFEKYTGKWYQSEKNEDVYLNVTAINNALMHFDFKSGIEFKGQETSLNDGESTMEMTSDGNTIKVNIKVFDDSIELTVIKSDSLYFTAGETYVFVIE